MPKLEYRPPSHEEMDKRANRPRGNFESFIKDDFKTWRRQKEGNYIRILPPPPGQHWALECFVHYEVGPTKASVLCPLQMKVGPGPVCDERNKLERRNVRKEELEAYRYAKCFIAWIQDMRNAEEMAKGPQIYRMSDSF